MSPIPLGFERRRLMAMDASVRKQAMTASWEAAASYHQKTKHHFHRSARSLGHMDWANQPDPFRRFTSAPLIRLPLSAEKQTTSYDALYERDDLPAQAVTLETLGSFFQLSLAISAWKEYEGSRWALRVNPSSGNLHPTEGYLLAPAIRNMHAEPGVYHYAPREHALELRSTIARATWEAMAVGFCPGTFFVALTSIHWREAWKYGERAYRYCQHDIGHALAAVRLAAAVHGWSVWLLETLSDEALAALLGLNRLKEFEPEDCEEPEVLAAIMPSASLGSECASIPPEIIRKIAGGSWNGKANRLSENHVHWDAIEAVATACNKPTTAPPKVEEAGTSACGSNVRIERTCTARQIILQRRSAVALDGVTSLTRDQFYLMLMRVFPTRRRVPWDIWRSQVCAHLAVFVHRVDGLKPGLYFLVRDPGQEAALHAALDTSFGWEEPPGCPAGLPFSLLQTGDCRQLAGQVSCGQAIAADGAFSLGMIVRFEESLKEHGAWFYRRLFWETGMIGQILYLEAEAAGVRSTGIGCFFDDPVHDVLGLRGMQYQSLYHFTVGGPTEDTRLTTLPPYDMNRPVR